MATEWNSPNTLAHCSQIYVKTNCMSLRAWCVQVLLVGAYLSSHAFSCITNCTENRLLENSGDNEEWRKQKDVAMEVKCSGMICIQTQNSRVLQEKPCCWILNSLIICFTLSTHSTCHQLDVPWIAEPGSPPPALGVYPAGHPAAMDRGTQWKTHWSAVVWNSWNLSHSPQRRWKQYAAGHPSLTAHAAAG